MSTVLVPISSSDPAVRALEDVVRAVISGTTAMPLVMSRGPTNGEAITFIIKRRHFRLTKSLLTIQGLAAVPVRWSPLPSTRYLRHLILGFELRNFVIRVKAPFVKAGLQRQLPGSFFSSGKKKEKKVSAGIGAKNAIYVTKGSPARVHSGGLPSLGKRK